MPTDDPIVKTSFRIPQSVLDQVEQAAKLGGMTVNGEVVFRLQNDPRSESVRAVLDEIKQRDAVIDEAKSRQIAALWSALDRASVTLEHVSAAMAQVPPDGSAAALKREVEFALELIEALSAHR
jgi:hypothetical protein